MSTSTHAIAPARVTRRPALRLRRAPILRLILERVAWGTLTLLIVSFLVFMATSVLPGNVATSVLGNLATPESVTSLEEQLGLNDPALERYWQWLTSAVQGEFGSSLANGASVTTFVVPRIINSLVLVTLAGIVSSLLGVGLGLMCAVYRNRPFDRVISGVVLGLASMPAFVVGVLLVVVFSTTVFHWFPAISTIPPEISPLSDPTKLVLPVLTLVVVTVPYITRMLRAVAIEALESDYAEMAVLKGVSTRRLLFSHVLPNTVAPIVQVIGVCLSFMAGGVVIVEALFNFPGAGSRLVEAVSARDIPVIQAITVAMTVFYIFINVATDAIALVATPRVRFPQS